MSSEQLFYEYFQGDYYCGDAVYHLRLAQTTLDAEMARKAGARCFDYARHLEQKQRRDPPHQPAPESEVPADWHGAVSEIRAGIPNSALVAEVQSSTESRQLDPEPIYLWGGQRWTIIGGVVFIWSKREGQWTESTMTPEQLRKDGQRLSEPT